MLGGSRAAPARGGDTRGPCARPWSGGEPGRARLRHDNRTGLWPRRSPAGKQWRNLANACGTSVSWQRGSRREVPVAVRGAGE